MRAYSDNEDLALLSGIDPNKVVLVTWIIAGSLATFAGVLYGLDKIYKPFIFLQMLLPIFSAAILGGVGNPIGAFIGGYIIALSELIVTFAYKRVLGYILPENLAPLVIKVSEKFDHIIASANTFGKNFMPRVAAMLDVSQVSDVTKVNGCLLYTSPSPRD